MNISIKEFLKTARFGEIRIGDTKERIIRSLGEPDSDNDMGANGCILMYGWYEFYIDNEGYLYAIQNDNYDPTEPETYQYKSGIIEIDYWFLNSKGNQDISSISELLKSEHIEAKRTEYYGREVIETKAGIIIDFEEEINKNGKRNLLGFRYWPQ